MIKSVIVLPYDKLRHQTLFDDPYYKDIRKDERNIFISIRDPNLENEVFPEDGDRWIRLFFWDAGSVFEQRNSFYLDMIQGGRYFDDTDIDKIFQFVKRWDDSEQEVNLYVNCEAGISRSGAVGTFVVELVGLDYNKFKAAHPWIHPNPSILAALNKRLWNGIRSTHCGEPQRPDHP